MDDFQVSAFHNWQALIHLPRYKTLEREPGMGVGMGHEFSFGPLEYRQFLKSLGERKEAAARGKSRIEGFKICERIGHV